MASATKTEMEKSARMQKAKFLPILLKMATCEANSDIIGFASDGNTLEIRNPKKLGQVLLQYFDHANVSSFKRQLNAYGFKTVTSDTITGTTAQSWRHPDFDASGVNSAKIMRSKPKMSKSLAFKQLQSDSNKRIEELTARIATLQQMQIDSERRINDLTIQNEELQQQNEILSKSTNALSVSSPKRLARTPSVSICDRCLDYYPKVLRADTNDIPQLENCDSNATREEYLALDVLLEI